MSKGSGKPRETWGSKIGLILAMAGNAVGLGNFLRFPYIAAQNGGGAFMIPYFISLFLLGIPLMLTEWALGRLGGRYHRGTAPAVLYAVVRHPIMKYLGILGILLPFIVVIYYTYIESWCFSLSFYSLMGKFQEIGAMASGTSDPGAYLKPFEGFINAFLGRTSPGFILHPSAAAYIGFLIVMVINLYILYRGITEGIEKFAKFAMPLLFFMAIILVIRVLTLKNPVDPNLTAIDGLKFLWEPKIQGLTNPKVWIAAAGQVFFTLSVGMGSILTYASYLKPKDDIALSSIATASLNEFGEVVLGGSIAIPAAVVFFGIAGTMEIASEAFKLGFVSMPAIFSNMPLGRIFGFLWFFLLFFAGITSSIALTTPIITFLQDEFKWSRGKAVAVIGVIWFLLSHFAIFFRDIVDHLDFWAGTVGIVFFGLILVLTFGWGLGKLERIYKEINEGGYITLPMWFAGIIRYITPVILIVILIWFVWSDISQAFSLLSQGAGLVEAFKASKILDFFSLPALISKMIIIGLFVFLGVMVGKMREFEETPLSES